MHQAVSAFVAVAAGLAMPAHPSAAQGQVPYQQNCNLVPLVFAARAPNRVSRDELSRLVTGREIVLLRPITVLTDGSSQGQRALDRLGRPTHRRYSFDLRADGSTRVRCDMIYGAGGRERTCPNVAQVDGAVGSTEVGVWQVAENALCMTFSRLGGGVEACAAIERHGGKLWMRHLRGPMRACLEGEVEIR